MSFCHCICHCVCLVFVNVCCHCVCIADRVVPRTITILLNNPEDDNDFVEMIMIMGVAVKFLSRSKTSSP